MLFLDRNKVSSYFWTVENLGRPRQAFHNFSIRSTMAKGSQLSQLKSALNQAGLSRQSSSKKRKRSTVSLCEHDKEKKEQKLKEIQTKLNPFEVKINKLKHDVGGRKLKGVTGKPQQSKQAGIEQVCIEILTLKPGTYTSSARSVEKEIFAEGIRA